MALSNGIYYISCVITQTFLQFDNDNIGINTTAWNFQGSKAQHMARCLHKNSRAPDLNRSSTLIIHYNQNSNVKTRIFDWAITSSQPPNLYSIQNLESQTYAAPSGPPPPGDPWSNVVSASVPTAWFIELLPDSTFAISPDDSFNFTWNVYGSFTANDTPVSILIQVRLLFSFSLGHLVSIEHSEWEWTFKYFPGAGHERSNDHSY
ncbi:hypothetical protein CVT26_009153 [Gymnopilus dilepis]|uniref:Uncharacterized protein n=1 Tax=Gymnopilus dilepis TaxID=231916 RepID=A0A409Y9M9_9AGAR|nr:hypothetical protein CVT26_009153 [Gymnopilus dilepis]